MGWSLLCAPEERGESTRQHACIDGMGKKNTPTEQREASGNDPSESPAAIIPPLPHLKRW